jgi:hypothetical protein
VNLCTLRTTWAEDCNSNAAICTVCCPRGICILTMPIGGFKPLRACSSPCWLCKHSQRSPFIMLDNASLKPENSRIRIANAAAAVASPEDTGFLPRARAVRCPCIYADGRLPSCSGYGVAIARMLKSLLQAELPAINLRLLCNSNRATHVGCKTLNAAC